MSCKLNKCSDKVETEDGFCCKHGYYSSTNEKHISMHIKKYLNEINNLDGKEQKIKKMINLWYYMTYKKEFFLKNKKVYVAILKKAEEIEKILIKDNYTKELDKFYNLHDQIMNFKTESNIWSIYTEYLQ